MFCLRRRFCREAFGKRRHRGHQEPRRWFSEQWGHRLAKSIVSQSFFHKMPHLVERDDHHVSLGRRFGKFARFVADPVQHRYVADAEKTSDGAKTDVAHGAEKQGQRLHRRRLPARRRHGEIVAAEKASIALKASNITILHIIRSSVCNKSRSWHEPFAFPAKGLPSKWLNLS